MPPTRSFINDFSEALKDASVLETFVKALTPIVLSAVKENIPSSESETTLFLIKSATEENAVLRNEVENLKETREKLKLQLVTQKEELNRLTDENMLLKSQIEAKSERSGDETKPKHLLLSVANNSSAQSLLNINENNEKSVQSNILFSSTAGNTSFDPLISRYRGPPLTSKLQKRSKIIGKGSATEACKIKSAKDISKKYVLNVDNVSSDVSCDDIKSYLQSSRIKVYSVYEKKSWIAKDNSSDDDAEDMESTIKAFRVCVDSEDKVTCMNADLWPRGVMIRPYKFKAKQKTDSQQENAKS